MKVIDLSGEWLCESPDGAVKKTVKLPGSSCENGIGTPAKYYEEYCKEAVRAPKERFEYIGELIYTKTVDIPADFEGMELSCFFERINISSKLFFDGVQVGRGVIGLSTPHEYRLTDRVDAKGQPLFKSFAGRHEIKLVIDNSNLLNMGDMASGYSVDTQGYWNGCIGRMELVAKPVCNVENVSVFKDGMGIKLAVVTHSDRHVPMDVKPAKLKFTLTTPDGAKITHEQDIELFSKRQRNWASIPLKPDEISLWDEFDTDLYTLNTVLECDGVRDEQVTEFGLRDISVEDKRFCINGRPFSLRGTINCAQYPLTGYPPMDEETWERHFKTLKSFGLNHVRFHAWCPPEAAFLAADRLGIYLAVEMPLWLNRDVTPQEFGDDEWHRLYYRDEALKISETYGNHPSFVMFSNGNENLGDYALLETMIAETKAVDNRRIYTLASNFDHPLSPYEDYLCAFEILHNKARIQFLHDEVAKSTTVDYDEMREKVPVPFTSFEVGQYCIYPDVDVCEKYTGNMLPVNFDIVRKEMKKHGVYGRLKEYIAASGDLAAKLYKEDIEAVLRTEGMGGFQLLSISDYTGQSTATVGILDVFFENKGVISPEEWRGFCSEVVPLLLAKREYTSKETLEGQLSLYDFGKTKIENPVYRLRIKNPKTGETVYSTDVVSTGRKTPISIPLSFVKENALLHVFVTVSNGSREYTNSWRIAVYAEDEESAAIPQDKVVSTKEGYEAAKEKGGRYLLTPDFFNKNELVKNSFIPVFWSPVHFPSEAPVGFMIDTEHEVLKHFPTEKYADYQWKKPVDGSVSIRIKDLGKPCKTIIEFVPNFADNEPKSALLEFNDQKATFLFCGFDLSAKDHATQTLKAGIAGWMVK
jgi:hypothetical protein